MERCGICDARVIQQDINPTPFAKGSINYLLAINHRIVIRDRVPVVGNDFINDSISAVFVAAFASNRYAQIVNNNPRPPFCKLMSIGSTDAITCAGNDNNTTLKCQCILNSENPL